ncbi:MAG: enoyl-CoA hydratase/isomerase family protein [Candidatus Lokiarchaeota archaeon]|nr:enoyl-CoA hydratase/isomerase family protein [Candidatus Lokiarchaeota archaeon]
MKEYKTLKIEEREEGISIITLNRPKRLNAINFELIEEFNDYLDYLENNYEIYVVILIGEGRAFSAGLDLKGINLLSNNELAKNDPRFKYLKTEDSIKVGHIFQKRLTQMMIKLRKIPQPVIAAVKGPAYGGGLAFSLAADIRIAGESAVFCNAFIKIGVSGADCGSTYWLPRIIGFSDAAEIIYTGKDVDAQEAKRIRLVSKVVPDDKILDEALKIAKNMLNKSVLGLRLTKQALNINIDAPSLEAAIELENQIQNVASQSIDAEEARVAFSEKREPKFSKW